MLITVVLATTIIIMKMMKRDTRETLFHTLTRSPNTSTTVLPLLSISQTACKPPATFQWTGTVLQIGVSTILIGFITPTAMTVQGKRTCHVHC